MGHYWLGKTKPKKAFISTRNTFKKLLKYIYIYIINRIFYRLTNYLPVPTTKSTLFVVSKDEWDTKEGTCKSMKNALHVQWYTSQAEVISNSEKIKPIALAIVELHESEGIRGTL